MDAVRVLRRTSASTGDAPAVWDAVPVRPFVLQTETVENVVVGDEAAILVTDLATLWPFTRDLVGKVHSEAAGTIPREEVAETIPDRLKKLLKEPVGTPVSLSRTEAVELAKRLFGSDKSLPRGDEYVAKVRGDWTLRLSAD